MKTLIDEIYTEQECLHIKTFFSEDSSLRDIIKKAIGDKITLSSEKILLSKPLDIIYLICLTSKFASSDEECHRIAITIYQYMNKVDDNLPYISDGCDLLFASKVLMTLSFRAKALEYRWKYRGAPSPKFYREVSKNIYTQNGQTDIAIHHEQWEGFLGELFV